MKINKLLFTSVLTIFLSTAYSQISAPAIAMPDEINTRLVDSIIKVTGHEAYFNKYCISKVKDHASRNNWEEAKINKIIRSINFKYYQSTIYNSYANYSADELSKLLDVLNAMNKKSSDWTKMVLTNHMMQNNLDLFVDGLVNGKYVTE